MNERLYVIGLIEIHFTPKMVKRVFLVESVERLNVAGAVENAEINSQTENVQLVKHAKETP